MEVHKETREASIATRAPLHFSYNHSNYPNTASTMAGNPSGAALPIHWETSQSCTTTRAWNFQKSVSVTSTAGSQSRGFFQAATPFLEQRFSIYIVQCSYCIVSMCLHFAPCSRCLRSKTRRFSHIQDSRLFWSVAMITLFSSHRNRKPSKTNVY